MDYAAAFNQATFNDTDWTAQSGPHRNWALTQNLSVSTINCPSSPMPVVYRDTTSRTATVNLGGGAPAQLNYQMSNYVGVSGTFTNGATMSGSPTPNTSSGYGLVAFNGVIVPADQPGNRVLRIRDITDGTTNTIMVGEQSDYRRPTGGTPVDARASNYLGGAWSGGQGVSIADPASTNGWTLNLTTVRYAINNRSTTTTGQANGYERNTSFTSAHTGGAQFLLADGSVRFISENLNFTTLTRLCDRADGQVIGEF